MPFRWRRLYFALNELNHILSQNTCDTDLGTYSVSNPYPFNSSCFNVQRPDNFRHHDMQAGFAGLYKQILSIKHALQGPVVPVDHLFRLSPKIILRILAELDVVGVVRCMQVFIFIPRDRFLYSNIKLL